MAIDDRFRNNAAASPASWLQLGLNFGQGTQDHMDIFTRVRAPRFVVALLLMATGPLASAQGLLVKRSADDAIPIASAVWAGDTLYVSGNVAEATLPAGAPAGTRPSINGDTRAQTLSTLTTIQKILKAQGLDMADVVQMHVYLVGDPALGGKMDFAGMNAGYGQFFGSKEQPNKPVRATVQVVALAAPGAMVEIEVTAVRSKR
jgi:enamine deaminase RidA (YjgF/YER057c/UK114 family)